MKYYLIGICGISMSALALFLKRERNLVCGSDSNPENQILLKNGIEIFKDKNIEKVKECDVVSFSSAIKEDNEDLKYARILGKKILSRGELLGQISKEYQNVIAIAGSHGKTTTTALIYNILKVANEEPSLHLGGILKEENTNFVVGKKKYFVTEACEYCDNFLFLSPKISVITNIEPEHLDYFKTFENQLKSFEKFRQKSEYVFEKNNEYYAKNIHYNKEGKLYFDLYKNSFFKQNYKKINKNSKKCKKNIKKSNFLLKNSILKAIFENKIKLKKYENGVKICSLCVNICEKVNIDNIIMAYRVCKFLKIPKNKIVEGIESFQGVKLRFESVRSKKFKNVILDYAHHPTEIKNTINTAKKVFKNKNIIFIFQPHTYSRTKNLLSEFISVFDNVENLVLYRTYEAREKEEDGISAKNLSHYLKNKNVYCDNLIELFEVLKSLDCETVLIFIGAGDLPNLLYKKNFIF